MDDLSTGSCTSIVRVIPGACKRGTMPPFHHRVRGQPMISDLLFYALLLVGLLWLCLMLHHMWPSERVIPGSTRPPPPLPPRQRSREPKPFAGLTHKPHCAACEQAAPPPTVPPPPAPPPQLNSPRGRPRQVDTSWHFCPHPTCAYRGGVGLSNISANGHPSGGPWRQLHCTACERYFLETHGTPFHGKRVAPTCWCGPWEPWPKG